MSPFPHPWTVEQIPGGYKVKDANGQALAHVYAREQQVGNACSGVARSSVSRFTPREKGRNRMPPKVTTTEARQGTGPRAMFWVLIISLARRP